MTDLSIALLAEHPRAVPILKEAFEVEWAPYYGAAGPGNAEVDLLESCNRNHLPVALVALLDNTVCGTAALKHESITTHKHLGPWLAALLVLPEYRHRGIGSALITAVEEKARALGFSTLYVGTSAADDRAAMDGLETQDRLRMHGRDGWEYVDRSGYFVGDVVVFRKNLISGDR